MKSFLLSLVTVSALCLGAAMNSTADAQYRVYRPTYGAAPRYNNYNGGVYGGQQSYYGGSYYGYPQGGYRAYYGGYGGGPFNGGGYYGGGYSNGAIYNGGYYAQPSYYGQPSYYAPGVSIGIGPGRLGFGY